MIRADHLQAVLEVWDERRERTVCRLIGSSMAPLIRHGDWLTIEHGRRRNRVGDIVVYRTEERYCAHLVVRGTGGDPHGLLVTQGVQNTTFDAPIEAREVLGQVVQLNGSNGRIRLTVPYWRLVTRLLAFRASVRAQLHSGRLSGVLSAGREVSRCLALDRLGLKRRIWAAVCLGGRSGPSASTGTGGEWNGREGADAEDRHTVPETRGRMDAL
jgi:signal peptidase I